MSVLQLHGKSPSLGRNLLSLRLSNFGDLPPSLQLPSRHFIVFIAADSAGFSVGDLSDFGKSLLEQGAVVLATWGPGCERFHDIIDETDLDVHPDDPDDAVILTTWHDNESLPEALWFAVDTILAAPAYADTCHTALVISVGDPGAAARIERWLSAPALLADEAQGSEGSSDGA